LVKSDGEQFPVVEHSSLIEIGRKILVTS